MSELIFGYFVGIVLLWGVCPLILFFIIRSAVRANEQISLLKEINARQASLIEAIITKANPPSENDGERKV